MSAERSGIVRVDLPWDHVLKLVLAAEPFKAALRRRIEKHRRAAIQLLSEENDTQANKAEAKIRSDERSLRNLQAILDRLIDECRAQCGVERCDKKLSVEEAMARLSSIRSQVNELLAEFRMDDLITVSKFLALITPQEFEAARRGPVDEDDDPA